MASSGSKQRKPFESEEALLQYSLKVLVEAGLTPKQVDNLRNKQNVDQFSKEVIGQRRFATSVLLAEGLSNQQIAEVFKQSKQTVAADREHIRKIYSDSILQNADHWRAKLLKEQDELKQKALESFEVSKRKVVRRVQERNGDEIVTTEEHCSAGESSFLTVAKGCLEHQARLLGLYEKKPEPETDDKSYKKFLENLSGQVKKIREAEKNAADRASAVDVEAEFDDEGNPDGASRPMLPADDDEDFLEDD